MNKEFRKYLSVSEFANLAGTTRKNLIFYDNEGIFRPEKRLDNGYRYYSLFQLDTFALIQDLRGLDMPLKEIKKYLGERTPQNCIDLLENHKTLLEIRIKSLEASKFAIEQKVKLTKIGIDKSDVEGVYFVTKAPIKVLEKKRKNLDIEYIMNDITDFVKHAQSIGAYMGYPIGVVIEAEQIERNEYTKLGRLFMEVANEVDDKYYKYYEETFCACILHRGLYEESYKSYEKLLDEIDKSEYERIGESYEYSILDFFSVKDEKDCLTEIVIPVKNKK